MSRVLITGSAQGLGLLAGRQLIAADHEVVLHARNPTRARAASAAAPGAIGVVVGDLASIEQTRQVAEQANVSGRFDAVIHNAGVFLEPQRVETVDGLAHVFAVNVLAPYLLTALIDRPGRLVFLSSGMHLGGDPDLDDLQWTRRRWNPRSEERRVGKECRSRWSAEHYKKNRRVLDFTSFNSIADLHIELFNCCAFY